MGPEESQNSLIVVNTLCFDVSYKMTVSVQFVRVTAVLIGGCTSKCFNKVLGILRPSLARGRRQGLLHPDHLLQKVLTVFGRRHVEHL